MTLRTFICYFIAIHNRTNLISEFEKPPRTIASQPHKFCESYWLLPVVWVILMNWWCHGKKFLWYVVYYLDMPLLSEVIIFCWKVGRINLIDKFYGLRIKLNLNQVVKVYNPVNWFKFGNSAINLLRHVLCIYSRKMYYIFWTLMQINIIIMSLSTFCNCSIKWKSRLIWR